MDVKVRADLVTTPTRKHEATDYPGPNAYRVWENEPLAYGPPPKLIRRESYGGIVRWYSIVGRSPSVDDLIDLGNAAALRLGFYSRQCLLNGEADEIENALHYLAPECVPNRFRRLRMRVGRLRSCTIGQRLFQFQRCLIDRIIHKGSPRHDWLRLGSNAGARFVTTALSKPASCYDPPIDARSELIFAGGFEEISACLQFAHLKGSRLSNRSFSAVLAHFNEWLPARGQPYEAFDIVPFDSESVSVARLQNSRENMLQSLTGLPPRLRSEDFRETISDFEEEDRLRSNSNPAELAVVESLRNGVHLKWDKVRRELRLNGALIRRVQGTKLAHQVVRLLDAFEESHWIPSIDDPLHGKTDSPQKRLNETIASLNKGLTVIKFHANGSGNGLFWDITEVDSLMSKENVMSLQYHAQMLSGMM
jgi:hypothetical protein